MANRRTINKALQLAKALQSSLDASRETELKKDPYFCRTCRHANCVCWPATPQDEGR